MLLKILLIPGKITPYDTTVMKWRIWPRDVHMNFHMSNESMLSIMNFGRYDFIIRSGLLKTMIKNRWTPLIGSAVARFRRSLPLFACIEIHTRLLSWDEKYGYFEQKVIHKKKIAGVLYTKGLFRAPGRNVPMPEVFKSLNINPEKSPIPEFVKLWLAMERDPDINVIKI